MLNKHRKRGLKKRENVQTFEPAVIERTSSGRWISAVYLLALVSGTKKIHALFDAFSAKSVILHKLNSSTTAKRVESMTLRDTSLGAASNR